MEHYAHLCLGLVALLIRILIEILSKLEVLNHCSVENFEVQTEDGESEDEQKLEGKVITERLAHL